MYAAGRHPAQPSPAKRSQAQRSPALCSAHLLSTSMSILSPCSRITCRCSSCAACTEGPRGWDHAGGTTREGPRGWVGRVREGRGSNSGSRHGCCPCGEGMAAPTPWQPTSHLAVGQHALPALEPHPPSAVRRHRAATCPTPGELGTSCPCLCLQHAPRTTCGWPACGSPSSWRSQRRCAAPQTAAQSAAR